jgi:PPP family 3-phenylpropionic acid transporter
MDFVPRLALLYGGIYGAIGVQLPFLPVWFAAKGLSDREIGFVLAAATVARVVVMPFATRAADHFGNLKLAILLSATACTCFLVGLSLADGLVAILICYALAATASGTTIPLTEAYSWRGLTQRGRAYGPVRVWASGAFIVGTILTGVLLRWIDQTNIVWILVGVYAYAVLAAFLLTPVDGAPASERKARVKDLLASPVLLIVILASALIQASHALYYAFATLHWTQAGIGGVTISALWILGVVAESFLFVASARFPPRINATFLIAVGAAGAVLRWGAMAFDPPLYALPFLQCLHAVSFAATYLGAVQFIAFAAPAGLAATAQGLLATANGTFMAGAMAISGVVFARYGMAGYGVMALIACAGGVAALAAHRYPHSAGSGGST